jgi:hypothetical protein
MRGGPAGGTPEAFASEVLDLASLRTGELLVDAAFRAEGEAEGLLGAAGRMVRAALRGSGELVRPRLALSLPVVAVGGPAPVLYPRAMDRLGTRLVIPPHHATANAVGAVVGRIERQARILVTTIGEQAWRVHLPDGPRDLGDLEQAVAEGAVVAEASAEAQARAAGAEQVAVTVERRERSFSDPTGVRRVLELELVATAIARLPIAQGPTG